MVNLNYLAIEGIKTNLKRGNTEMKSFDYTIKDEIGIHARPAGLLAKEAKKYESTVTIVAGEKSAQATKLMAIMGLGVKCGDTVTLNVEGSDEETAAAQLEAFFNENL
jgi:phosphocarrier protein